MVDARARPAALPGDAPSLPSHADREAVRAMTPQEYAERWATYVNKLRSQPEGALYRSDSTGATHVLRSLRGGNAYFEEAGALSADAARRSKHSSPRSSISSTSSSASLPPLVDLSRPAGPSVAGYKVLYSVVQAHERWEAARQSAVNARDNTAQFAEAIQELDESGQQLRLACAGLRRHLQAEGTREKKDPSDVLEDMRAGLADELKHPSVTAAAEHVLNEFVERTVPAPAVALYFRSHLDPHAPAAAAKYGSDAIRRNLLDMQAKVGACFLVPAQRGTLRALEVVKRDDQNLLLRDVASDATFTATFADLDRVHADGRFVAAPSARLYLPQYFDAAQARE